MKVGFALGLLLGIALTLFVGYTCLSDHIQEHKREVAHARVDGMRTTANRIYAKMEHNCGFASTIAGTQECIERAQDIAYGDE